MKTNVKQVIVVRKDLKMSVGKIAAQASHASQTWLLERIKDFNPDPLFFTEEEQKWMNGIYTKVCLQVNNEEELLELYEKAKNEELTVHLITDVGLTHFKNIPTKTCLCIGPHENHKIDKLTSNLKLLS